MTHANISSPSGNCSATRFAPACLMRHTVLCTCTAPAVCCSVVMCLQAQMTAAKACSMTE